MAEIDDFEKNYGSADHAHGRVRAGKYHSIWTHKGHVADRAYHYGTRSYKYRKKEAAKERKEDAKKHSSSKSGKGSSGKSNAEKEQEYQETMAESQKLEEIQPQMFPNHVDHLPGSIAKYGMSNINARSGYMKVTLSTISGTYPLVPRTYSHDIPADSEQKLISDLISVQITNDIQNDIPTCTFVLGNQYDWSSLLSVNDLIRVDYVIPYKQGDGNSGTDFGGWSAYADNSVVKIPQLPDDPNYDKAEALYQQAPEPPKAPYADGNWTRCMYTGLISNLTRNESFSGNQETYTIVGQGMAKIMSNIQLSTFSDLQSNLNGYQLLPDDEKTGIGFKGHTSANIVKQIINKFILQNQGGTNTYDFEQAQNGDDITMRASAITRGIFKDWMKGPMTEEQYQAYMDALADEQDDDSNSDSDKDDDSDDD